MAIYQKPYQKKSGLWKFITSPFACALFILVAFLLGRSLWGLYAKVEASRGARDNSERELANIMDRKEFVEGEIGRLKTSGGVEEEIRRKFNVVKPGEEVVVVVGEEEEATTTPEEGFFEGLYDRSRSFFKGLIGENES